MGAGCGKEADREAGFMGVRLWRPSGLFDVCQVQLGHCLVL